MAFEAGDNGWDEDETLAEAYMHLQQGKTNRVNGIMDTSLSGYSSMWQTSSAIMEELGNGCGGKVDKEREDSNAIGGAELAVWLMPILDPQSIMCRGEMCQVCVTV